MNFGSNGAPQDDSAKFSWDHGVGAAEELEHSGTAMYASGDPEKAAYAAGPPPPPPPVFQGYPAPAPVEIAPKRRRAGARCCPALGLCACVTLVVILVLLGLMVTGGVVAGLVFGLRPTPDDNRPPPPPPRPTGRPAARAPTAGNTADGDCCTPGQYICGANLTSAGASCALSGTDASDLFYCGEGNNITRLQSCPFGGGCIWGGPDTTFGDGCDSPARLSTSIAQTSAYKCAFEGQVICGRTLASYQTYEPECDWDVDDNFMNWLYTTTCTTTGCIAEPTANCGDNYCATGEEQGEDNRCLLHSGGGKVVTYSE